MAYEKLGFTSGQTLKAEHLNHMEEGIANAGGGAGIEYYTGEVVIDGETAILTGLNFFDFRDGYYQMEIATRLHSDTNYPAYAEYSWSVASMGNLVDSYVTAKSAPGYDSVADKKLPVARLDSHWTGDNCDVIIVFDDSADSCVPVSNPQLLYVRLYPKV